MAAHHDDGFDDEPSGDDPDDGSDDDLGGALDYLYADDGVVTSAAGGTEDDVPAHDDEPTGFGYTVTNPPQTVTVTALMDGRIHRVRLAPGVTNMTEVELAEEILVIAGLARQDGRSAQYDVMYSGLRDLGHDRAEAKDFLSRSLDLPSPEDAAATRAHIFATRYSGEVDANE
ncbi:MAG: YbaB/EbfC family DNA-binding protein [Mycobacterium sp.]|nr:MAG: YbaB/EbfC family DNA-binding protein [Mycobacterium sp.]